MDLLWLLQERARLLGDEAGKEGATGEGWAGALAAARPRKHQNNSVAASPLMKRLAEIIMILALLLYNVCFILDVLYGQIDVVYRSTYVCCNHTHSVNSLHQSKLTPIPILSRESDQLQPSKMKNPLAPCA